MFSAGMESFILLVKTFRKNSPNIVHYTGRDDFPDVLTHPTPGPQTYWR